MSGNHMEAVQSYVKAHFGVQYEDEILVWGPLQTQRHTWQTATVHNITATYTFNGPIDAEMGMEQQAQQVLLGTVPESNIDGEINPFNRDLRVCGVYGMKAVSGTSSYPFYTTFRTNYCHPAYAKNMREKDEEMVAGGGIRGAVSYLPPHTNEAIDLNGPFLGVRDYHYHNPEFIKSTAYVLPSNLMNGIFAIPRKTCIASYNEQNFPVYRPDEPDLQECEELEGKILFWYFVPLDHVLAWAFHVSPEYRRQKQMNVITYRVKRRTSMGGDVFKLAFLVCNNTLNRAKQGYLRTFAGCVHLTDLRSLDVEMVPALNMAAKTQEQQQLIPKHGLHEGEAKLRVLIAYCLYEKMTDQQVAQLCPTLSPHFPLYASYIMGGKQEDTSIN